MSALINYGPSLKTIVGHYRNTQEGESERALALVDTGASLSCIDDALAIRLRLPVVDTQIISGVGGSQVHNVYMGAITIPDLEFEQVGKFAGVHLCEGGQPHSVLLGRTFLQYVKMIYDGKKGKVEISMNDFPQKSR